MNGGKDEEWNMVSYKDYEISLMTEEQREAMDLEWKWNNPTSEEIIDKHIAMKMQKGRKRQFEDL
jgi:ribosomal silencing factor RsfS